MGLTFRKPYKDIADNKEEMTQYCMKTDSDVSEAEAAVQNKIIAQPINKHFLDLSRAKINTGQETGICLFLYI